MNHSHEIIINDCIDTLDDAKNESHIFSPAIIVTFAVLPIHRHLYWIMQGNKNECYTIDRQNKSVHEGVKYQCQNCPKSFVKFAGLRSHIKW